jgi:hypothetical protein
MFQAEHNRNDDKQGEIQVQYLSLSASNCVHGAGNCFMELP